VILPDKRLHQMLALLLLLAIIASLWPAWLSLWWLLVLLLMSLAIGDGLLLFAPVNLQVSREINSTLPLGSWQPVSLHLLQQSPRPLRLQIFDHPPATMQCRQMPAELLLQPEKLQVLQYQVRAQQRGDVCFPRVQARLQSPLRLWWRNILLPVVNYCKVYPNFTAVSQYDLLAMENRLGLLGVKKQPRRGDGQDFFQLRDYRHGDTLRQIDWKTTSRMRKLISREYQEERNQDIVFLLDCSHRMGTQDGEQSHFDHSLDAIMLLTHIAQRQGDEVGVATFGHRSERWLPPVGGQRGLNQIMQCVYDLQPGDGAADYVRAATTLLQRQKRRALIILVTNIQDQDSEALRSAADMLTHKHLLVLASLREAVLDNALETPVETFEQALQRSALHHYLLQRQTTFNRLPPRNTINLDVRPDQLATGLINEYFRIKRANRL